MAVKSASDVESRVVESVRSFLDKLVTNEAICTIAHGDETVSFRDVEQVRRSTERLAADNIDEESVQFDGFFIGVLPKRRRFEFQVAGSEEIIAGKIGPQIDDPQEINRHLYLNTVAEFIRKRVGAGHPRFTLIGIPDWRGEGS